MVTIGELNSLMIFEELLDGPKAVDDIRRALLTEGRKRREIPLLLPYSLDDFLEIHKRHGTLRSSTADGITVYEVLPELAQIMRAKIDQAFSPVSAHEMTRGDTGNFGHRAAV